ncbi:MAG: S1/P1 nuclease [Lysobacteraceae bacterium]|jgi:hypothetical protein|nr:S1/P1 nuclease [Silanimonas sp.]
MPAERRVPTSLAALLAAGLLSLWPGDTAAWGREGHRIVGLLAEARLTPDARGEVARLLDGAPEPTLAGVSTWADEVRDQPEWRHTGRWHWVNLPRETPCTYDARRDCQGGNCVVGAIEAQRAILADRSRPDAERAVALKFLVHLVGDVHQPFHAGFGDDRGGNLAQIRVERRGWNLHALWDSAMVEQAGLSPDAYAAALQAAPALPPDPTSGRPERAAAWALQSCRAIFDDGLYPETRTVGRAYLERHRPLAERRLREAGERLAAELNAALAMPR